MELSIFLARVMGIYLLVMSIAMFTRKQQFQEMIELFEKNPTCMTVAMIMTLILGIMIVVSHNVWVMGWPVVITILGWWMLIKGLLRLFFPKVISKMISFVQHKSPYLAIGGLCFLLGLFLICKGFFY